jgi:nucleotidyltransferase AbiEii toxin of type IV toxin-antitoxin system
LSVPALHEDFRDLILALQANEVRFVIVGAHAMAAHGVPRATGDLDVLVAPDAENAARLVQALERFGAPLESHGVSARDFERTGTVYQIGLPPRRIDLMTSISGVDFEEAERTAIAVDLEGLSLPILGRRQLIANKRASGRPKDILDVQLLGERSND